MDPATQTKSDVPYIGMRTLVISHICLILFILLVHWKLSTMTGF